MSELIDLRNLKRITKGKIGEWIARDYYRSKGYIVWFLEQYCKEGDLYSFYSGTGREYVNERLVLSPLERAVLSSTRAFDLLAVPKEDVDKIKSTAKIMYHEFDILQGIFVNVLHEDGVEGLIDFINMSTESKKEFIKHKLKDLGGPYSIIRDLAESYWYKRLLECLKGMDDWEIEGIPSEPGLGFVIKGKNVSKRESKQEYMILLRDLRLSHALKTLEHIIETRMNDLERHWIELTKLTRKLVDVKTKWSEYDYPGNVKRKKDSELINLLKLLGFECETLEVCLPSTEIKISSFKL